MSLLYRCSRLVYRSCVKTGPRWVASVRKLYTENAPSRGPPYTTDLAEATASLSSSGPLPAYRVMDGNGAVLDPSQDPNVSARRYGSLSLFH